MSAREITVSLKFVNQGIAKAAEQIAVLSKSMEALNASFKGMNAGQIKAIMKALADQGKKTTEVTKKATEAKKKQVDTWSEAIQVGHKHAAQQQQQLTIAARYGQAMQKNTQSKAMSVEWDRKVIAEKKRLEKVHADEINTKIKGERVIFSLLQSEEEYNKVQRSSASLITRQAKAMIKKNFIAAKFLGVSYDQYIADKRNLAQGKGTLAFQKEMTKMDLMKSASSRSVTTANNLVTSSQSAVNSMAKAGNVAFKTGSKTLINWIRSAKNAAIANSKMGSSLGNSWSAAGKLVAVLAAGVLTFNQTYTLLSRIGRIAKWLYGEFTQLVQAYSELIRVARSAAFILGASTDSIMKAASEVTLLGISMTEAAKGLDEFGRAGFKLKEAVGSYVPIALFAKAANVELSRATTMVTGSMKAFGFGAKDVWRISNGMINAIYKSRNSFESLETAMSYAAAAGGAFGQEYEDVLSTVSAFRDIGLQESTAGTAYRRSINQFAFISSAAKKSFKELGLDAEDFRLNSLRSFNDVIKKLADLKNSVADVKLNKLVKDLVGKRFGAYIKRLVDATYEGSVALKATSEDYAKDSRLLAASAKNNMRHITNQLDVLKGVWEKAHTLVVGFAADFVNEYLAAFNFVINTVLDALLKKYGQIADEFKKMDATAMVKKFNEFEKSVNDKMTAIILKFAEFRNMFSSIAPVIDWAVNSFKAFLLILAGLGTALIATGAGIGLLMNSVYTVGVTFGAGIKNAIDKMLYTIKFLTTNAMTWVYNDVLALLIDLEKMIVKQDIMGGMFSKNAIYRNFQSLFVGIFKMIDGFTKYISDKTGLARIFGNDDLLKQYEAGAGALRAGLAIAGVEADKTKERIQKAVEAIDSKAQWRSSTISLEAYNLEMKQLDERTQKTFDEASVNKFSTAMADTLIKTKNVAKEIVDMFGKMPNDSDAASKSIDKLLGKLAKLMKQGKELYKTTSPGALVDKAVQERMHPTDTGDPKLMQATASQTRLYLGIDKPKETHKEELAMTKYFSDQKNLIKAKDLAKAQYIDGATALSFTNAHNAVVFALHDRGEISDAELEKRIMTEEAFKEVMNLSNEESIERLENLAAKSVEFSGIFGQSFEAAIMAMGTFQTMTADLASSMASSMQQGMANMFMSVFDKTKKIKDVIKDMGKAMLQSLATYLSKMILQTLIFGKIMGKLAADQSKREASSQASGAMIAAYRRGWEAAPGWGGFVLAKAFLSEATAVTTGILGSMTKLNSGTGLAGVPGVGSSDTELALLTPGEIVLNPQESDDYRERAAKGGSESVIVNIYASDWESFVNRTKQATLDMLSGDAEVRRAYKTSLARQG